MLIYYRVNSAFPTKIFSRPCRKSETARVHWLGRVCGYFLSMALPSLGNLERKFDQKMLIYYRVNSAFPTKYSPDLAANLKPLECIGWVEFVVIFYLWRFHLWAISGENFDRKVLIYTRVNSAFPNKFSPDLAANLKPLECIGWVEFVVIFYLWRFHLWAISGEGLIT